MKKHLLIPIATMLAAIAAPCIANAQLYVNAEIGGVPSVGGATVDTLNEPSPSILALSGPAYLVTGANYGVAYAPPCFSGTQASYFGEPTMAGYSYWPWDGSQYVAIEIGGSATFSFSTPQNYFGILWGTFGQGDTLTFYDNANNIIGTVLGQNLPVVSSGDWGPNGTAYVNITSTTEFSRIVASAANNSFEFDDVAYAMIPVPEPGNGVLLGCGFCILGVSLRRKLAKTAASQRASATT